MDEKKIEQIGVKLPEGKARVFKSLADRRGVSSPELIRKLIDDYIPLQYDECRTLVSIFSDESAIPKDI